MFAWNKRKNVPQDAFTTLTPLYRILRIFSFTSVTRENNQLKISHSKWKRITVMTFIFFITVLVSVAKVLHYKQFFNSQMNRTIKFTDSIQLTYLLQFGQYIANNYFAYKYGCNGITLKYFKLYEKIDKVLGITYNSVIRAKVIKITIILPLIGFLISALDFASWMISYGWMIPVLYSMDYIFFILNSFIIIEIISNVMQVEYRLRTMGDILQDFYSSSSNLMDVVEDVVCDKNWLYYTKKNSFQKLKDTKIIVYNNNYDIMSFNKCYLLLIETNTFINKSYGLRVSFRIE